MKNLILENYDSLKESNYIRKTEPKSKYWGDFSYNKMEKFKTASNGNFNLIIYGDANKLDDYYIIPFSKLKDKLIEKSFSKDKDVITRKRWIFTIDNHNLKISNSEGTIDINEFYSVPIKNISQLPKLSTTMDYKSILKEFTTAIGDSNNNAYYQRYITSLIAKPFVIITGNSGTGKTRIARIIAKWLSREKTLESGHSYSIHKGKVHDDGFYWQVEAYHVNLDRIVFKKEFADQFFNMPEYQKPVDIKILIESKTYKCRFRQSSNGSPHVYGIKEISEWLKNIGVGNIFKVIFLPEEEGFSNVIRFERVKQDAEIERSIQYYALVPVGADWTDNRSVLGYYNPIKEVYQSTQILDLVIDAKDNPDKPFFLILDEMNLSHVERYFSDFLSAMESGEELTLHSESETIQSTSGKMIPAKLGLPSNLFITGTVNIDETTYMFSPKVLDRSNVIEFSISETDISDYFQRKGNVELDIIDAEDDIKEAFIDLSEKIRNKKTIHFPIPDEFASKIEKVILDLYKILKSGEMEFAYRTIDEILRYARGSYQLQADWKLEDCVDEQILQKVLPKLHGSRKKLEKILVALLEYSHSGDLEKSLKRIESNMELTFAGNPKFKNSFLKLERMLKSLKQDGFVSFIQ